MTKALVVAGGDFPETIKLKSYDYVLAVDRGLEYLIKEKIDIDFIIGDFDSVSIDIKDFPKAEVLKYPSEKAMTDLEIAFEKLIDLGVSEAHILGATGTRLDHSLINVFLLEKLYAAGIKASIINDHNLVFMEKGSIEVKKNSYKYLSLISLRPCKVSIRGFKYNLDQAQVDFPSSLTISNEIVDDLAYIEVDEPSFIILAND